MEKQNYAFAGVITEIKPVRSGNTQRGDWANVTFEVTEQTESYPQIAQFDFFKNGDNVKYASNFNFKVGELVIVHFNLGKTEYTNKQGEAASFYKNNAWKIEKVEQVESVPEQQDDLPW